MRNKRNKHKYIIKIQQTISKIKKQDIFYNLEPHKSAPNPKTNNRN